jgi:hypothetical protein
LVRFARRALDVSLLVVSKAAAEHLGRATACTFSADGDALVLAGRGQPGGEVVEFAWTQVAAEECGGFSACEPLLVGCVDGVAQDQQPQLVAFGLRRTGLGRQDMSGRFGGVGDQGVCGLQVCRGDPGATA